MRPFLTAIRLGLGLLCACASVSSHAISMNITSTADNRAAVATGATMDVRLSAVSGTVSISNTNTASVTVTKISSTTTSAVYRLKGLSTGLANVTFKDLKGKVTAYLKVTLTQGTLDGRQLASNCYQCHGTNGTGGFERLLGESYAEIYGELSEFITDEDGEEDGEVMRAHALGYTDAQMRALANYLSQLR